MRRHINVPAYSVAQWLLVNFWRLRWEPARPALSPDWLESHSMAGISGDQAWPPVVAKNPLHRLMQPSRTD
ncbi:MAG: hypothetical protein JW940_23640, partial [Polyangiaceae bacterium]|nr:hypothetical protein [Polyangiaceae bacterium]